MRFFPLNAGLHIGSQSLSLAVLERHRDFYRVHSAKVTELPAGIVQPSPSASNISDPAELQSRLKALFEPFKGIKKVSVSLPDPSVRAALIPADGQAVKGGDLDSLIRWQMERLFLSPLGKARVMHLPIPSPRKALLAVTIQDEILQQYEGPLKNLGIQPVWANISSFLLFNLYHDFLTGFAGPSGRFLVLNLFDRVFTLLIFGGGMIDFIRIKALSSASPSLSGAGTPSAGPEELDEDALSEVIMHELNTSLSFYSQSQDPSLLTHLFIFGRRTSDFIKRAHDQYHVEVESLEPARLTFLQGLSMIPPEEVSSMTPAVAAAFEGACQTAWMGARRLSSGPAAGGRNPVQRKQGPA